MLNRRDFLGAAATGVGFALASRAADSTAPPLGYAMFDSHLQLLSADTVRYPRGPDAAGSAAGPDQSADVEKLMTWLDQAHVAGGVAVQRRDFYGYNNYYVLDSADRFRSRLMPVVALDAADPGTPELLQQYVRERGLAGLQLSGVLSSDGSLPWLESPAALKSWAVAEEQGLAVTIATTPPGRMPVAIAAYARLAREYPNARLVLDHLAWPDVRGAPDYGIDAVHRNLALFRNIYFKFTSVNIAQLSLARISPAEMLRRMVDAFGAERVMWGSSVGTLGGTTYAELVQRAVAATAQLNADEQRRILRDTGMRVFVRGGLRRA